MATKKKAKSIAISLLLLTLSIGGGLLITGQFRSLPVRVTDPIIPYTSLKETRDELYAEQDQLKVEIASLQDSISKVQSQNDNNILTQKEISDLNQKKALAGLTKLSGPGLGVTLDDSQTTIPATEDSIIHAADIRDVINVLWASGAEGISINGQRVVLTTAIDCIVNTILVNNIRLSNPYKIEAIGNPNALYNSVSASAALSSLRSRQRGYNINFSLKKMNSIQLPVYDGSLGSSIGS